MKNSVVYEIINEIMNEKITLNVIDDPYPALIHKNFKYVKSKTKLTRIPKTVCYKNQFRNKPIDQANSVNLSFQNWVTRVVLQPRDFFRKVRDFDQSV